MKIVGAVSDESSLGEIESIAKVFAYEQRMRQYASPQKKPFQASTTNPDIALKSSKQLERLATNKPLHHSLVKGLC